MPAKNKPTLNALVAEAIEELTLYNWDRNDSEPDGLAFKRDMLKMVATRVIRTVRRFDKRR